MKVQEFRNHNKIENLIFSHIQNLLTSGWLETIEIKIILKLKIILSFILI